MASLGIGTGPEGADARKARTACVRMRTTTLQAHRLTDDEIRLQFGDFNLQLRENSPCRLKATAGRDAGVDAGVGADSGNRFETVKGRQTLRCIGTPSVVNKRRFDPAVADFKNDLLPWDEAIPRAGRVPPPLSLVACVDSTRIAVLPTKSF